MPDGFTITEHAVHRFQSRIVPELSFAAADALLRRRVRKAQPAGEKTFTGETYWRITAPNAVLVTKSEDKRVVVVTVIEPDKLPQPDPDDDLVVEHYRRQQALQLAQEQLAEARDLYERRVREAKDRYHQVVGNVLKECPEDVREQLRRSGVAATREE